MHSGNVQPWLPCRAGPLGEAYPEFCGIGDGEGGLGMDAGTWWKRCQSRPRHAVGEWFSVASPWLLHYSAVLVVSFLEGHGPSCLWSVLENSQLLLLLPSYASIAGNAIVCWPLLLWPICHDFLYIGPLISCISFWVFLLTFPFHLSLFICLFWC